MRELTVAGLKVRIAGGDDREGGGTGPLVVLLHGFGAPGEDLVSLYRQIDAPHSVRFAFPAAPLDLGSTLGRQYAGARAWWMIDFAMLDPNARASLPDRSRSVPDGLVEARTTVTAFLAELMRTLDAKPDQTILGGFSQGSMLSLDVALHSDVAFGGLILMSSTVLNLNEWEPLLPKLRGVPVLQSHGRSDAVLPFDAAERLRDLLKNAGAELTWVEFGGGHAIPNGVLDAASAMITKLAGESAD
ncbi:MAG TPA: hypothetical protein VH142_19085 [Polyangiaceae bacterium]|jgi:phospholipase/carboxylesterase|nr:hypothetical protein [Polyangiaceae bacterium]